MNTNTITHMSGKGIRNPDIDIMRGMAVFFVLWGHSIQYLCQDTFDFFENPAFRFIYSFHMALFMSISGYLFWNSCQKRTIYELLVKLCRNIFYPLVIWNSIMFMIPFTEFLISEWGYKSSGLHNIITLEGIASVIKIAYSSLQGLWFLWSIFFCSVVVAIVSKLPDGWKQALGFLVGFLVLSIIPNKIEISKENNIWMYPYFVGGYLFHRYKVDAGRKNKDISRVVKSIVILSIVIFAALFPFFHREYYIYTSGMTRIINSKGMWKQILIDVYRWVLGGSGTIAFVGFMLWLLRITQGKCKKAKAAIKLLGMKSMQVYILQSLLLERLFKRLYKALTEWFDLSWVVSNQMIYSFIITPMIALIFAVVIIWSVKAFEKMRIEKMLFGR